MSRYRLLPTPTQEAVLRDHCGHARYVWNLAVEQHSHWHPGRTSAPGYLEQCRQLTAARAEHPWLAAGSQTVQQQALRDFARAMAAFVDPANPAGRPSWRKAGRDEGFRITGRRGRQWDVRRVSRKVGEVWVPKAGWMRFRWSRAVPPGVRSYRVTMDRAGRWHVAFAAIPGPVPAPGNAQVVGVDRGVAVSAALSTGELLHVPGLTARERKRLLRLERTLARARRGSQPPRAGEARHRPAEGARDRPPQGLGGEDQHRPGSPVRHHPGREPGRHGHDPVGPGNCRCARPERPGQGRAEPGHPAIGVGLAGAPAGGEGARPGGEDQTRVDEPAVLGVRAGGPELRESQAVFRCTACGLADNADVNAAKNIAAGHAVTARGGDGAARPVNREPHLLLPSA